MANPATYTVEIDTALDGQYALSIDVLTERVVRVQWSNGAAAPYGQDVVPPTTLTLELMNVDGVFDIERSGATYENVITPGMLVRVKMTHSAVTQQLWEGRVAVVEPQLGAKRGQNIVRITCRDLMHELTRYEYLPRLQTNVRVDEALTAFFDEAEIAYPYDTGVFMLGFGKLGTTTTLWGAANITNFEQAQTTIAFAGDVETQSNAAIRAWDFIVDVVDQECGGRFFWDGRSSRFVFHNRHRDVSAANATDATLTSDEIWTIQPRYGDDLVNRIVLRYAPRTVGSAGTVLYDAENVPFDIAPGKTRRIIARYRDIDNADVGVAASVVIAPTLGTDVLTSNNSGVTLAANTRATATEFEITNNTDAAITVTQLRVRGTPLFEYQPEEIIQEDLNSWGLYGKRSETYHRRIQSEADADNYSKVLLETFKTPSVRVDRVTYNVESAALAVIARSVGVGDIVRVNDSANSGHDRLYVVMGEQHQLEARREAAQHVVTYVLKPADKIAMWALGVSGLGELGENTYLGF